MGCYINPPNMTKEMFLDKNGVQLPGAPKVYRETYEGEIFLACVLADNGPFTAAGVCYNQPELEDWQFPRDTRKKTWYWVSFEELKTVSPVSDYYKP